MTGTRLPASVSAPLARPRAWLRRWLTDAERGALSEQGAVRLSLFRAIGEGSPSADLVTTWLNLIDVDNTRISYGTALRQFVEWLRARHGVDLEHGVDPGIRRTAPPAQAGRPRRVARPTDTGAAPRHPTDRRARHRRALSHARDGRASRW